MITPHPDDHLHDPDGDDGDPPWVIPVREPDPGVVAPPAAGLGQALAVVVLGVVVFAAAMVFGADVLVEDPDAGTGTTADPAVASGSAGDTEVRGDVVVAPHASSPPERDAADDAASVTSTSAGEATTTTEQAPTTTGSEGETGSSDSGRSDTGEVPPLSSSFEGGWVAQLSSVPRSSGTDRLETAWRAVRADVPDARAAVSDDWASLRPGYWVLVHAGPFDSAAEVRRFCDGVDHDCLARELVRD